MRSASGVGGSFPDLGRLLGANDRATPQTRVPRMWSAGDLAAHIGVSVSWVRGWSERGILRGYLLRAEPGRGRGRLLFREEDVIRFLEARGLPVGEREDGGDAE